MKLFASSLIAVAAMGVATPAAAATTLDFAGSICGVAGNLACGNGSQIGQNYGDSAEVDVAYRSINTTTNVTHEAFLKHWTTGYGDLTNVVWGGPGPVGFKSEITFTPIAGYEVQLISLDAGCYVNRSSCQTLNYDIRDGDGNVILAGSQGTNFPNHTSLLVNSTWESSGIVLQWGPDGYDTGLDNIVFDVREIGVVVPEPATWALMMLGFGAVGGTLRRRNVATTVRYA